MKLFKYTLYVFDFEKCGSEEYKLLLSQNRHMINRVFYNGEAEIGEWDDDHELNQSSSTQLTFDKFFES